MGTGSACCWRALLIVHLSSVQISVRFEGSDYWSLPLSMWRWLQDPLAHGAIQFFINAGFQCKENSSCLHPDGFNGWVEMQREGGACVAAKDSLKYCSELLADCLVARLAHTLPSPLNAQRIKPHKAEKTSAAAVSHDQIQKAIKVLLANPKFAHSQDGDTVALEVSNQ